MSRSLPGAPRLFTFGCAGRRIEATSAGPPWSSAQNYKNAKCYFLFFLNEQPVPKESLKGEGRV